MSSTIHAVRLRIDSALQCLAQARTTMPRASFEASASAIDGAELALCQALKDWPAPPPASARLRPQRLLMENLTLDDRPRAVEAKPFRLTIDDGRASVDEVVPAVTSWRS